MTDTLGGFHFDESLRKWPAGSLWANEGERLYRLVRDHKPAVIVEVGTHVGCSASHMALACKHNGAGHVYSIDNRQTLGDKTGSMIPAELMPWVTLIQADGLAYPFDSHFPAGVDLLFEDGSHSPGATRTVLQRCPAKIVAVHDYCAHDCRNEVPGEAREVLGEPSEVFFEPPSDCGLAIWFRE